MTKLFRTAGWQWLLAMCLALAGLGLAGCSTGEPPQFKPIQGQARGGGGGAGGSVPGELHVGDTVTVRFSEVDTAIPDHIERIKDDGTLTLGLIGSIVAAGKTPGQLQTEIHDLYVPRYYRTMNVVVLPQDQYIYVGGEVKQPNRYLYQGTMTVLTAIQTAGDFTDFANKAKVKLTRSNGQSQVVNCKHLLQDPSQDIPIYPGDRIYVPRRFF